MSDRIRYRLLRRLLIAVAAIVLYAVAAFALAALISDGSWPAIGDHGFSSGQATVVPAINVFAAGAIILAILQPILSVLARVILDLLLAVAAASAGPVLSVVSGDSTAAGLLTVGMLALAASGIVVAFARTCLTKQSAAPKSPASPR